MGQGITRLLLYGVTIIGGITRFRKQIFTTLDITIPTVVAL